MRHEAGGSASRPWLALLALTLLWTTACGRAGAPGDGGPSRSVILISIDSLRADRLGCYGHDAETSPALDGLAAGGVRFSRAWAPSPWVVPVLTMS